MKQFAIVRLFRLSHQKIKYNALTVEREAYVRQTILIKQQNQNDIKSQTKLVIYRYTSRFP